jgi:hypothetical protein
MTNVLSLQPPVLRPRGAGTNESAALVGAAGSPEGEIKLKVGLHKHAATKVFLKIKLFCVFMQALDYHWRN